ncbi:amino acid adenylation domain-containing protein [Pseudonocardia sp. MCCB 268]|nr:amino acid adenylation domain-containing protein [Pseudonocardia cytotoxica]
MVTRRNLDWMASVLAVFKAGGACLPIEPHFPPERIRDHAVPRRVPARPDRATSTANLDRARVARRRRPWDLAGRRPGARRAARRRPRRRDRPGPARLPVLHLRLDRGAQGARCASTRACSATRQDRGPGDRRGQAGRADRAAVFDISLWQLVSALLVPAGARC